MNDLEQVIERLIAQGFYVQRKVRKEGSTIIVSRGTRRVEGIDQLDRLVILVLRDTFWDLQIPLSTPGGVIEHGYSTIEACNRTIEYLTIPQDQIYRAFRAAFQSVSGPTLEFWYPDCLSIHEELQHPK